MSRLPASSKPQHASSQTLSWSFSTGMSSRPSPPSRRYLEVSEQARHRGRRLANIPVAVGAAAGFTPASAPLPRVRPQRRLGRAPDTRSWSSPCRCTGIGPRSLSPFRGNDAVGYEPFPPGSFLALFFWKWDVVDNWRCPSAISTSPAVPLPLRDGRQCAELCGDEPPGERLPLILLGEMGIEHHLQRLGRHFQPDELLLPLQPG
jgi:hypothetical protein